MADVLKPNSIDRHAHGYRSATAKRTSILFGIALSLLLHALGLWLLTENVPVIEKTAAPGADKSISVSLARPEAVPAPSAPQSMPAPRSMPAPAVPEAKKTLSKPSIHKKPAGKKIAKASKPSRMPEIASKAAPKPTQPEDAQRKFSVPDDMFTQIEAARKRRTEARAREGMPEPSDSSSAQNKPLDDNSIARANIEFSRQHAQGKGRDDVGGVFELRSVGYQNAEVLFKGWSERSRRNALRLIPVEKGTETDIQLAVVKKIIGVIREEKKGDFVWESHRLGKDITLSARPQDTAELRQFLLREFFPDYVPAAPKG